MAAALHAFGRRSSPIGVIGPWCANVVVVIAVEGSASPVHSLIPWGDYTTVFDAKTPSGVTFATRWCTISTADCSGGHRSCYGCLLAPLIAKMRVGGGGGGHYNQVVSEEAVCAIIARSGVKKRSYFDIALR